MSATNEPDASERGLVARALASRSVFAATLGLWLLVGLAVLAPFVANEAPWYVRALDRGEYESARRSLVPLAKSRDRLAHMDDAQYERERMQGATSTRSQAIEREEAALRLRARVLRRALNASSTSEALDALDRDLDARSSGTLVEHAERAAEELDLGADARSPQRRDGAPAIELVARASSPLAASLSSWSVLAAVAWLASGVLLVRARRARASLACVSAACAVCVLAAIAWTVARPDDARLDARGWKERLASSSVTVERAVFAPIPMGFAESNASETWRPPTWLASADVDDDGRYVHATPSSNELHVAPPSPVLVRPGEPARNAWNRHLLGTDGLGRDVAARILWGARVSLAIGFGAALLLALIGTLVGAVAGTLGGLVDRVVSRVLEIVLCFPAFFLVLAFAAVADPRVVPPALSVVLVIGFVGWTGVARLVRAECMKLAGAEFVLAARAQGFSTPRVLFVHVLPNALAPALVALSLAVGTAILTESALSFLGLGVEIPVPSWGALAAESRDLGHWWMLAFPGTCVFASAVFANVLGEGVRDALDPRGPRGPRDG